MPQHAGNTTSMADLRSRPTQGDRHQTHDSATRARSDSVEDQGRSGPDSLAGSVAPLSSGLGPVWFPHDFATLIWPPLMPKFGPPARLTDPFRFPRDRGGLVGQESPRGVVRRDSSGASVRRRDN